MEENAVAGILGTLAGAIISGVISFWLQRSEFNRAKSERVANEFKIKRSHLNRLDFKLTRIRDQINLLSDYVQRCRFAPFEGEPINFWKSRWPINNVIEKVDITEQESSFMLDEKESKLHHDIGYVMAQMDAIYFIIGYHREKYQKLIELYLEKQYLSDDKDSENSQVGNVQIFAYRLNDINNVTTDFYNLIIATKAALIPIMERFVLYYSAQLPEDYKVSRSQGVITG